MWEGAVTDPFAEQRIKMVRNQIEKRGLTSPRVLEAMRSVPRHRFVLPEQVDEAYNDTPLPVGWGQTISQPYIVALMTILLRLEGSETVLEIGTGSGYQAAVLARLVRQVYSLELVPALAERSQTTLNNLGVTNVNVQVGDGSRGLPQFAPYEGILVTAAAPIVPQPLLEQLGIGGRLVIPVGKHGEQVLQVWDRLETGWDMEEIVPVAFVPLRGSLGWKEDEWNE